MEVFDHNGRFVFWKQRFDDLVIWLEKQFRIKVDYIHNNPVKAGLVERAVDYPYSSARDWLTGIELDCGSEPKVIWWSAALVCPAKHLADVDTRSLKSRYQMFRLSPHASFIEGNKRNIDTLARNQVLFARGPHGMMWGFRLSENSVDSEADSGDQRQDVSS
jgi:hypothetical protein